MKRNETIRINMTNTYNTIVPLMTGINLDGVSYVAEAILQFRYARGAAIKVSHAIFGNAPKAGIAINAAERNMSVKR